MAAPLWGGPFFVAQLCVLVSVKINVAMTRISVLLILLVGLTCLWAQDSQPPSSSTAPPRSDDKAAAQPPAYSSSKDTKIDLGPPPGQRDPLDAPPDTGVTEMRPFNPHQADKDVEVGTYYFKQKNYCGALNRFYSALYYDSRDAIAAFRLAETYEKLGDIADARKHYQQYLDIWAKGPLAPDAQKKLAELNNAPDGEVPECGLLPPDTMSKGPAEKPNPAGTDLPVPK